MWHFCKCYDDHGVLSPGCSCGENADGGGDVDWNFEGGRMTETAKVRSGSQGRGVSIRRTFSEGNAACLGNVALNPGCLHFWEIKPDWHVYGTSAVVGVATSDFAFDSITCSYEHGIGKDAESWGYSYKGSWVHGGSHTPAKPWGQGSIVGVLLDRWRGTLAFYLNREPLGIAFKGGKVD